MYTGIMHGLIMDLMKPGIVTERVATVLRQDHTPLEHGLQQQLQRVQPPEHRKEAAQHAVQQRPKV